MSEPEADPPVTPGAGNPETQQLGTTSMDAILSSVRAAVREEVRVATASLATGASGVASSPAGTALGSAGSVPTSSSGEYAY